MKGVNCNATFRKLRSEIERKHRFSEFALAVRPELVVLVLQHHVIEIDGLLETEVTLTIRAGTPTGATALADV